jgi:hypothetical protein
MQTELKGIEAMEKILITGFQLRSMGRAINQIFFVITANRQKNIKTTALKSNYIIDDEVCE